PSKPKMLKLLVLTLLLTATVTVNAQGIDIGNIIKGLNDKALGLLRNVAIPVLNKQVGLVKAHIDGILAFFQDKEGDIAVPNTPFSIHFVAERCR
ncbi:hypothetical protein P5E99_15980, partial [Clostridium perfringens]|nr:hypothetical protein [Clostridium perfringens]